MQNSLSYCQLIRQKVLQSTGIPISIGIASTKTLAKIANRQAKALLSLSGVCLLSDLNEIDLLLSSLSVGEVWGIGRRLSRFLAKQGVFTARQLRDQDDQWVRHHLSVMGLRTVWELRGIPCFTIEDSPSPKQSIMTSRSFE